MDRCVCVCVCDSAETDSYAVIFEFLRTAGECEIVCERQHQQQLEEDL